MNAHSLVRAALLALLACAPGCMITRGTLEALLTRETRQVQSMEAAVVSSAHPAKLVARVRFTDGTVQELERTLGSPELIYGPEGSLSLPPELPPVPAGSTRAPPAAPIWVDLDRVVLHHHGERAYLGRREDRDQPAFVVLGVLLTPFTILLDVAAFPVNLAALLEPDVRRVHVSKARR